MYDVFLFLEFRHLLLRYLTSLLFEIVKS